jgi:uncharacterized NAD(P)/FAD-binding protein YdhS
MAINLLRAPGVRVTLIERTRRLARGAAYSTARPEHLLNVRASGMSAFADAPAHFSDWHAAHGGDTPADFARRCDYGAYCEELLARAKAQAKERLALVEGDAIDVERHGDGEHVRLADGRSVTADVVFLSIGNLAPELPSGLDASALPPGAYVADPWAQDLAAGLGDDDKVLLIGTGLTAIDAALSLDASGFRGTILALSRRGLVPRSHSHEPEAVPPRQEDVASTAANLLVQIRERASAIGWRGAVDQLRPFTQTLWRDTGVAERRRFLRHLRPWWDVHRHRIAPAISGWIGDMEKEGRLAFRAGKIVAVHREDHGACLQWRPRGSASVAEARVRRIVNCTGPSGNIGRSGEPLLVNLLAAGRIRPDPLRIGIDVAQDCRTIGREGNEQYSLLAIGPMTRGAFWEIVAVPDIRAQVAALAERLADNA